MVSLPISQFLLNTAASILECISNNGIARRIAHQSSFLLRGNQILKRPEVGIKRHFKLLGNGRDLLVTSLANYDIWG